MQRTANPVVAFNSIALSDAVNATPVGGKPQQLINHRLDKRAETVAAS